jgi:cytochrome c oxidase subunit II
MGRKHAVTAAVLAILALACAPFALAGTGGLSPPPPTTPSGEAISELYWFVFAICAVVFVAVESALVLFIIRFRRRRTAAADAEGPQIHGNTRLEIIWTLIPALILVVIAVVVFVRVPAVQAEGQGGQLIRVEAHQFYWQYVYEDENGVVSLDRLVLPVERPVRLVFTSRDVDHSWWVPELTGKRDAIPGRTTTLNFTPEKVGTYEGKCAELCGVLHTVMPTVVQVVSLSRYEQFISRRADQGAGDAQLELGRETFAAVCADCHGPEGEGDYGPSIQGNGTLSNPQALRDLLDNGQDLPDAEGYMPPVGLGWPDFQLEALIAYIESNETLSGAGQEGAQSGG